MLESILASRTQREIVREIGGVYSAVAGVARAQRLHDPRSLHGLSVRGEAVLQASDIQTWNELFGVPFRDRLVPFTYHAPVASVGRNRMLRQIGANVKNVLLLKSSIGYSRYYEGSLRGGARYFYEATFDAMGMISSRHAALRIFWELNNVQQDVICRGADCYVMRDVEWHDRYTLEHGGAPASLFEVDFGQFKAREPMLWSRNHRTYPLSFSASMATRYGRVSGDMNLVHTNRSLSRVLGFTGPIAHGGWIANQIIKATVVDAKLACRNLQINYCRPVHLGDTATLVIAGQDFEVLGQDDTVLVHGVCG